MLRRRATTLAISSSKESTCSIVLDRPSEKRMQLFACRRLSPDRKSTRLNSSHANISYAVFCLIKKELSLFSRSSPQHLLLTSSPVHSHPLPLVSPPLSTALELFLSVSSSLTAFPDSTSTRLDP